ncbi:MAG: sigma 54-interacting transcriptional regulator [Syntrophomonadaceae bacterium]
MRITIDKRDVTAKNGETILAAARKAGILIPNLCGFKNVCGGNGLCRICIVEITDAQGTRLVESCTYQVTETMEVRTSTPLIENLRRSIISLLVGKGVLPPDNVAKFIGTSQTQLWQEMMGAFKSGHPENIEPDIIRQGLLENPYLAYIIVDKDGRIRAINDSTLDRIDLKLEDALGQYILDVIPNSQLQEIVATGRTDKAEFWPINGHSTIVNRVPLTKNGETIGAIGYSLFLDMSEPLMFMQKLQEREKEFNDFLQGLLENPYLAYIIVDQNGYITAINQATLERIEIEKKDAMGKYILDIVPNSQLLEIIESGRTDRAEFWTINGHETIVCRMPIKKEGEIIGAIGYSLFLDMTGAKILGKRLQEMEKELKHYKDEISEIYQAKWELTNLIGESRAFSWIRSVVERMSFTTSTVLIMGESGTGKELFAQAIHNSSNRKSGPFIRINCVALPENLLESELFGYEEGAFTGAKKGGKPGKFELAAGGTIFLDEIGDMPMAMQTKLLAVLQEKVIERIGGTKPIPVDVRIIAATNRNLEQMVTDGQFREDLYYRLNVVRLDIPPLRDRMDDLPLLVNNLIKRINLKLSTDIESISPPALELLAQHNWPGNVRELENLLERAINLAFMNGERGLGISHFPSLLNHSLKESALMDNSDLSLPETLENLEKELIIKALGKAGGNKNQAAKLLGIHISALYRKMGKYDMA